MCFLFRLWSTFKFSRGLCCVFNAQNVCFRANACVYTLCILVLTYMHISSYSADTSGSVPLQDSNPICSLYVQLKQRSGMLYCVPIIFLQMFPATFLQCVLPSPTPPTSEFGWQASEIPGLSVELFTMPQIHHRRAIEAHCVHPLTVSMVEPYKGPAWRGSLVRGPPPS